MSLLTPSVAKGEKFLNGTSDFRQSDDASDPAVFNPIEASALEADEIKSFLELTRQLIENSTARYVLNDSGSDIPANSLVYISGYDATTGAFKILLADGTNPAKIPTHVTLAVIVDGANGIAYQAGVTGANINTSAASAVGALVYLDVATPGAFTFTAPTAPSRIIPVGMVLVDDSSVGQISFDIGHTYVQKLIDLSDVDVTGLIEGDLLKYNYSTGKFSRVVMTNGQVIVGKTSYGPQIVTLGTDASIDNAGALTITGHAVTNAKQAQMAAKTFKGNNTTSAADAIDMTAAEAAAILPANSIANSQLAQMEALTFKGNNTTSTADAINMTVAQALTLLGADAPVRVARTSDSTARTSSDSIADDSVLVLALAANKYYRLRGMLLMLHATANGNQFSVSWGYSGTGILDLNLMRGASFYVFTNVTSFPATPQSAYVDTDAKDLYMVDAIMKTTDAGNFAFRWTSVDVNNLICKAGSFLEAVLLG